MSPLGEDLPAKKKKMEVSVLSHLPQNPKPSSDVCSNFCLKGKRDPTSLSPLERGVLSSLSFAQSATQKGDGSACVNFCHGEKKKGRKISLRKKRGQRLIPAAFRVDGKQEGRSFRRFQTEVKERLWLHLKGGRDGQGKKKQKRKKKKGLADPRGKQWYWWGPGGRRGDEIAAGRNKTKEKKEKKPPHFLKKKQGKRKVNLCRIEGECPVSALRGSLQDCCREHRSRVMGKGKTMDL